MPDDQRTQEIEKRIDREITGALTIAQHGQGSLVVAPRNMTEVMEVAKLMSVSGICIRPMFRGNPGSCLAIVLQAMKWGADPFAVANKAFEVNGQLSYESQLVHAIVNASPALSRRLQATFSGEGQTRRCLIVGHIRGEDEPREYESPKLGEITPKNSPLWKSDPDQQLFYYSARAWARRWVPEILLGIYVPEELSTIELRPSPPEPPPRPRREDFITQQPEPAAEPEPGFAVVDLDGVETEYASADVAESHLSMLMTEAAKRGIGALQGIWESNAEGAGLGEAAVRRLLPEYVRHHEKLTKPVPHPDAERSPGPEQPPTAFAPTPDPGEPLHPDPPPGAPPAGLIAAGNAEALRGMVALEAWWRGLGTAQRGLLGARGRGVGPYLHAWKRIAEETDAHPPAPASTDQRPFAAPATEPAHTVAYAEQTEEAPASSPTGHGPTATTGASPSERISRELPPVIFGGKPDWSIWFNAVFLLKLKAEANAAGLADLIGDNADNLDNARDTLGAAAVDDALRDKWWEFNPAPADDDFPGEHHAPTSQGEPPAGNQQPQPGGDRDAGPMPAGEPFDLLGDAPAENVTVPLPPHDATPEQLGYYARQLLAATAEKPGDVARLARIKMKNETGIRRLKTEAVGAYDEVQRALAEARR